MRIISGIYKGKRLFTPADESVRPTSDMTRESLFNLLMHGDYEGFHIIGKPVADLCCGTGAIGLEALSRGAAHCLFVDQAKASLTLAEKNAQHVGAGAHAAFHLADIAQLGNAPRPSSVVFLDAPYHSAFLPRTLEALLAKNWLLPHGLLVVEQAKHEPAYEVNGLTLLDNRNYGKASLRIYQKNGENL